MTTGVNTGDVPVTALFGLAGDVDLSLPDVTHPPSDVQRIDYAFDDAMSVLPSESANVSIQHLELLPGDSFIYGSNTDLRFLPLFDPQHADGLSLASGEIDRWSPELKSVPIRVPAGLTILGKGTHTLFNLGEETIDIYFFVVEPYPNPATPTP
jgi:hypothetical protein